MIDGTLDAHSWRCFSQNFSQISKSNFLESKKWLWMLFFLLTAVDALIFSSKKSHSLSLHGIPVSFMY